MFAGPAVRKVRREAGLTQAAMADALDISPSYLNLIEHSQRPLSATVIVRLAERFGFDAAKLGADEVPGGLAGHRVSPTVCCVVCGILPRCVPRGISPSRSLTWR